MHRALIQRVEQSIYCLPFIYVIYIYILVLQLTNDNCNSLMFCPFTLESNGITSAVTMYLLHCSYMYVTSMNNILTIAALTLIFSVDIQLGKHYDVMGIIGTISDPILLCQGAWCVYNELLCGIVISCCCSHLDSIVTITKLSQAKAAHIF